jgi:hypothetical protein
MNISSSFATGSFGNRLLTMATAARPALRFLVWVILVLVCLLMLFVLFPPEGVRPGQGPRVSGVQTVVVIATMFVSGLAAKVLADSRNPDRKSWIAVLFAVVAVTLAALRWLPQWSGFVAVATYVLFVATPGVLSQIANRRRTAGYAQDAAFYWRLVYFFHPSRYVHFVSSLVSVEALGSIEKKVARYRELAVRATPEQFADLNWRIPVAQGDWEGALGQLRSADDATPALKCFEIRALGELGRVDEMVSTYASAKYVLSPLDLLFCRLYILAFAGRLDGVRFLLGRQLRFLRPLNKAYWIFIAVRAAGGHDDDARHSLASYARAAESETFRVNAQRHLDAMPMSCGVALSSELQATIAAIEETLLNSKGVPR